MNKETHTRNQKRMYRIHKLEEKIHNQDLLIGNLQQRIDKANQTIDNYMMMETDEVGRIEQLRVIKRCLGGKE
jgi:predicted ATP-dependent protease